MIIDSPIISGSQSASGPLNQIGNVQITGSLSVTGAINGSITGSVTSASYATTAEFLDGLDSTSFVFTSSFNTFSGSTAGRITNLEAFSSSLDATFATDASVTASILVLSQSVQASEAALSSSYAIVSGSYALASGSLSIRTSNLEATSSTLVSASGSFAVVSASFSSTSGSLSTRVTNLEATSSTVSSSFATTSGSIAGRMTIIEGQDATTGSNTFTGPQFINQASNAIGFTSTASLYTDGGLRVSKDSFVSGTAYFNNVVVYGTSSIQYITSSQVNFGTNIITVNTDTPAVRFGGLAVFDSGSTQLTGSILWDSQTNHWVYSNPSGSSYSGGMIMSGPRSSALGSEQGTTNNALMKGQGGDHITSSQVIDDGTTVRIPGNLQVTGSTVLSNTLTGTSAAFTGSVNVSGSFIVTTTAPELQVGTTGVTLGNALTDIHQVTGSVRISGSLAGVGATFSSNVAVGGSNFSYSAANRGNITLNGTSGIIGFNNSGTAMGYFFHDGTNMQMWNELSGSLIFGTNAVTRLTISNTGAATFSSSVTANSFVATSTGNANVFNAASATTGWVQIAMNNTNGSAILAIESNTAGTTTNGSLAYATILRNYTATALQFATNNIVRTTITSGGSVGIGTSSPTTTLTVKSSNDNGYALTRPSNDTVEHWKLSTTETGGDAYTVAYNTFNCDQIFTTYAGGGTGGNIILRTGGTSGTITERMRINSSGLVTITGAGTGNTSEGVFFKRTSNLLQGGYINGNGGVFNIIATNEQSSVNGNIVFSRFNGTTVTESMRINSDGNVGIGTSSPNTYSAFGTGIGLDVASSTTNAPANINIVGNGSGYAGLNLGNATIRRAGIFAEDGSVLTFYTNGSNSGTSVTERMRITSGGLVGIGTTSPSSAGGSYGGLDIRGSGGGSLVLGTTSAIYTYLYAEPSALYIQTTSTLPILFLPGGSERMRITSDGNVGLGTTTPSTFRLSVAGAGNVVAISSSNNSLSLALGYQGTMHGYLGGISSRLEAYSNNGGYVFLNSSSAWVPASDIKRKRNFETYSLGLDAILGLQPKLYNMDFQEDEDEKQVGLIAQEVKDFIPIAYEENDKFIGLNYNAIIVTMINAIQELSAKVDAQAAEINELKNK